MGTNGYLAAQSNDSSRVLLHFKFESPLPNIKIKKLQLPSKKIPLFRVDLEVERLMNSLYSYGYISAKARIVSSDSNEIWYSINAGPQYSWKELLPGNVDEGVLSKIGFRDKIYRDRPMSYSDIRKMFRKLIIYYENHGHPFASINLDSVSI